MDTPERPELVDADVLVQLTKSFEDSKNAELAKIAEERKGRVALIMKEEALELRTLIGPKTREAALQGKSEVVISSRCEETWASEHVAGWREACYEIINEYRIAQSKLRLEIQRGEYSRSDDSPNYAIHQFVASWGEQRPPRW